MKGWSWEESFHRDKELEAEGVKMCIRYLGPDPSNVCGAWAMKVCAREGFSAGGAVQCLLQENLWVPGLQSPAGKPETFRNTNASRVLQ